MVLLTMGITLFIAISSSVNRFRSQLDVFKDSLYESRKADMKRDVESAIALIDLERTTVKENMEKELVHNVRNGRDIIDHYFQQNHQRQSNDQMVDTLAEILRPFRFFGGEGYYFILSGSGKEILYPIFPQKEGESSMDWKDSEGVYFVREMIEMARTLGEGFVHYQIERPGFTGRNHKKIAYISYYAPLDIIIGSGYYLDSAEEIARDKAIYSLELFGRNRMEPFFGASYDGVTLLGSSKGVNRLTNPVGDSAEIITQLVAIARKGGGYYEYTMPPLDEESRVTKKLSYVESYPQWRWYIGTGSYMDILTEMVDLERDLIRNEVLGNLKYIIGGLLFLYLILFMLVRSISKPIRNSADEFVEALEVAVDKDLPMDLSLIRFSEFKTIAANTNRILDEKKVSQSALFQKQKLEAIGRLAGGVAHDINNQLTAVMGYADLIAAQDLDDNLKGYLEGVLEGAHRASNLVRELLRFSRKENVKKARIDMHEIMNRIKIFLEHTADKGIQIRLETAAVDSFISGDENKLYSMLLNMVINSVDSFSKGGLIILTSSNPQGAETLQLEVRDNGSGIAQEDQDKIFDLFYTTKPPGKGTGLGLSLVYDTVKEHGGTIDVESQPGKGSCFRISFPLDRGDDFE